MMEPREQAEAERDAAFTAIEAAKNVNGYEIGAYEEVMSILRRVDTSEWAGRE